MTKKVLPPHAHCAHDAMNVRRLACQANDSFSLASVRTLGSILLVAVLLAGSARPVDAQQWRQTTRVMAAVESGQATRAFLDSVAARLRANDTLTVRQSRDASEPITASALNDSLLQDGLGMQSANRVMLDYEFEVVDNELIEEIQGLQFLYRPPSNTEQDVPIMYVDAERPMVQDLMRTSGIPDETNLSTVHYFVDELSFPALSIDQNVEVVSVSGRTIRGEFDRRRRVLLRRLKTFIYERDKVYSTQIINQS